MTTVLLVDDQELVRTGFRLILDLEPGIDVVGEAANGAQGVQLVAELHPDVVLMDVRMPVLDGIRATERIVAGGSASRVLILTTFDLDEFVYDALRVGASGFLLKDAPRDQLVSAVRVVAGGESLLAPPITRRLIERFIGQPPPGRTSDAMSALSDREREVLGLLARGSSNAEIAGQLFLSDATVKTHVARLLAKLGVRDRMQAVILAYETGFILPGGNPAPPVR
ncbi:DNA-binding NarL/FixJ family response regulator [Cryobacterium mesophilum]|uniref:Response regulator transcription factor n=1 Tax=Terrimesophilobacter mesophilus TaxID=433647 RepID=A0A4R8VB52_9MICO|nr:response regulator transcription factor [Terrimesophilobacter mesophilus]MBB5632505.1 DNA-binding NarL/FixJ family response regulator [Terrimesophilobacter mesophilus]TFB79330.1 response regulator transcription factor [Terrimesophilobacter mesophilus]